MIFQHHRFQIWNQQQHPFRHNLSELLYTNPALPPSITNISDALNYVIAVLYPQTKPSVATPAALPAVGNTINDYRVVQDDGDGKAAAYRWEQREGEGSPSWHKVGDLDFGVDSILQQWNLDTLSRYVSKWGHNDLDASGVEYAGDDEGQHIYGGTNPNSHLTLNANSGDATGPQTGFIQFKGNVRPYQAGVYDLGTTSKTFNHGYFATAIHTNNTNYGDSYISDGTGSFSFSALDLTGINTAVFGTTLTIGSGSISDSSNSIAFGSNDFTGVGSISCSDVQATTAVSALFSGSTIGDLTLSDGSIVSSGGTISFGANDLITTADVTCDNLYTTDISIIANVISATTLATNLDLTATQYVRSLKTFYGLDGAEFSGSDVNVTGVKLQVYGAGSEIVCDELAMNGKTLSSTVGELWIVPFGTNLTMFGTGIYPYLNDGNDLGKSGNEWQKLWLGTAIGNVSGEITMTDLLALKSTPYRDTGRTIPAVAGDALFWSGTEWLASAPDTEIEHSDLNGITTGDAGHTQFALLTGRSGGQTLSGGNAASESLTLSSTSHATKGSVLTDSNFIPTSASAIDLGQSGAEFRHVITTGEFKGFRLENLASTPGFSAPTAGRLIFNTTDTDVYLDTGTAMKRLNHNRYSADTSWNGTDTTKTVTVDDVDARYAVWQLKDNSNNYEVIYCKIEALSTTSVQITVSPALPAGAYRLTGVE